MRLQWNTLAFIGIAIAALVALVLLALGPSAPPVSAATPVVDPIPNQIANGGYATTLGLAANTIQVEVSWTDADAAGTHDVVMDWGDGTSDTFFNASNPQVTQHTYSATGPYYGASAQVMDPSAGDPFEFFAVAVLNVPAEAEAKLVSGEFTQSTYKYGQALDFDGTRAVVGSQWEPRSTQQRGRVYSYTRSGSQWTLEQTIRATPGNVDDEHFGSAVVLDGDHLAVGVESYQTDPTGSGVEPGGVIMFERIGGVWTQGQVITPADGADNDTFGAAVALQGDRLAVGSPRHDQSGISESGGV